MNYKKISLQKVFFCVGIITAFVGTAVSVKATAHPISDLPPLGDIKAAGKLVQEGDAAFAVTKVQEALADYQAALAASPFYEDAEIGAARCTAAEGDYDNAIKYYCASINGHHEEDDIDEMTEYILVLVRAGQSQEAVNAYNHVVDLCKKGYSVRKMELVPQKFSPDGSDYDPDELQAMTHLMRAMNSDSEGDGQADSEIQKAITLTPDSALVYYYKGILLDREKMSGARAAFQKAAALDEDNGNVKAAAEAALAGR
jgi:tetratricopeptide (TPR) repeat protein